MSTVPGQVQIPLSEEYGKGQLLSVAGDPPEVMRRRRNHVSMQISGEVSTLQGSEEVLIAHNGLLDLGYWRGFSGYVRTNSPLGALRELGNDLPTRYRGWTSDYATRFVFTDEPPMVYPIQKDRRPDGTVVLQVAPWISPKSVKNAYLRELWLQGWMSVQYDKREARGNRKAKSEFRRRRRLADKTLKLLRFVTERIDDPRARSKAREIAAQWDAAFPDWAYQGNTGRMWRDYNRALRAVAPDAVSTGHC